MFSQLQPENVDKVSELQELSLFEYSFRLDRAWFQFPPQAKGGKYSSNSLRNSLKHYSENDYC